MQVLQGKAEEAEGEDEMLPTLYHMQQGWESTLPRVFPHLAFLLSHGFGGSVQTQDMHGSKEMEAASIQHREGTDSSPFPREGVNMPQTELQAPCFPPGTPHRAHVSLTQQDSPQQCWGQQPSSLEREAWPCCLLTDPEVQITGTSALGRFDAPTAYYGAGSI